MDPKDLFDDSKMDIDIDGLHLVDIDLESIDKEAQDDAINLIHNLSRFYYDEDFMRRNPAFKKRIDADLESLRILFKMRKTDEEAHDILIRAIAGNSGNASLYKSLADMQKTIISITTKIGDIITGLNTMMRSYQLELNFDEKEDNKEESSDSSTSCRGSKDFILKMAEMDYKESPELPLFDEEEEA